MLASRDVMQARPADLTEKLTGATPILRRLEVDILRLKVTSQ